MATAITEALPFVDPAALPVESGEYTIRLPQFEGPLDLLLHLIRKHELDLFDIPIAFITSEYLTHLRLLETLDVNVSSEFLVMAATLVHIKSQMLLPTPYLRAQLSDHDYKKSLQPDDPRFELVQALMARQTLADIAELLGERETRARAIYTPDFERPIEWIGTEPIYDCSDLTLAKLMTAFERVLTHEQPPGMTVIAPRLTVGDVMREIRHLHRTGQLSFAFSSLVAAEPQPFRVVAVFLALLELAREGRVILRQASFADEIVAEWTLESREAA
ncbi:MAG: segregation/condensation protein A [bacterium]